MNGPLVEEVTVSLVLNGLEVLQWRCTPADIEALVIGRLYIDGMIEHADDAHLIVEQASNGDFTVQARISGVAGLRTRRENSLPIPDASVLHQLFRQLFQTVDARHEQGGMHASAACDGQNIVRQGEDVGRHNTIDKIAGALLLEGQTPNGFGLLTSSRISGEIAHKAARAGFAWLASRSIPTTMAVRFASEAHMPIIGRAASRDAWIYQ